MSPAKKASKPSPLSGPSAPPTGIGTQSTPTPTQFRQGDVLLVAVGATPDGCRPIPAEAGRFVLAHGEATGHAHAVAVAGAEFVEHTGERRRFLRVPDADGAELRHEEHAPIRLPRGVYEVRRQREFRRPFWDAINFQWVRD